MRCSFTSCKRMALPRAALIKLSLLLLMAMWSASAVAEDRPFLALHLTCSAI